MKTTSSEWEQSYFRVTQLSCPSFCTISFSPPPFKACINCLAPFNILTPQRLPYCIRDSHLWTMQIKGKCTNVISPQTNYIFFLPIKGYCIIMWILYYHKDLLNNQEEDTQAGRNLPSNGQTAPSFSLLSLRALLMQTLSWKVISLYVLNINILLSPVFPAHVLRH